MNTPQVNRTFVSMCGLNVSAKSYVPIPHKTFLSMSGVNIIAKPYIPVSKSNIK